MDTVHIGGFHVFDRDGLSGNFSYTPCSCALLGRGVETHAQGAPGIHRAPTGHDLIGRDARQFLDHHGVTMDSSSTVRGHGSFGLAGIP